MVAPIILNLKLKLNIKANAVQIKRNIDYEIKAKNLYVGIMPLRSLIQQKWILKIRPEQTEINIYKDFFKRHKSNQNTQSTNKSKCKNSISRDYCILRIFRYLFIK